MFNQVLIIANPASGKNKAVEYAKQLESMLIDNYSSTVTIKETKKAGDAKEWASDLDHLKYDAIVCLGGDGTVNETVQGILANQHQPIFGFIPLGTVNDLGRAIGYSMNPTEAIKQFKNVSPSPMDIAQVNDEYFVNVLAIGAIPESVMDTDSKEKNTWGFLAYFKDAMSSIFNSKEMELLISYDDQEVLINTNLVICSLTNSVGGFDYLFPEAKIDDGLLHLMAVKGSAPIDLIKAVIDGTISKVETTDNLLVFEKEKIDIKINPNSKTSNKELWANIDGDKGPKLPLNIKILPKAIKVFRPNNGEFNNGM